MFVASNFLGAVARILDIVLNALSWLIIIRALISWVNPDPFNPIVQFLHKVTDPLLYRIRRTLPFTVAGGIDFSPLVAILAIMFLRMFAVKSLFDLVSRM
jgi:YggT family protein